MAQINQNLSGHEAQQGFDCLPPGWYRGKVIDSEIKEGQKGPYINWKWGIVGKPNQIFDVMSLGSDISLSRLKTMAVACGHSNPNFITDTEELHGKECQIRLKIEKDESGKYDDKNRISSFKALQQESSPPKVQSALPQEIAPQAASNGAPPPPQPTITPQPWQAAQ